MLNKVRLGRQYLERQDAKHWFTKNTYFSYEFLYLVNGNALYRDTIQFSDSMIDRTVM